MIFTIWSEAQGYRERNDEHSLVSAPFMLNSAELMAKLGYNWRVLEDGFNDQNLHPRPSAMVSWFNERWGSLLRANAPGRTRQYIMDGMKIYGFSQKSADETQEDFPRLTAKPGARIRRQPEKEISGWR